MDATLTESIAVLCDSGLSDPRPFFVAVERILHELNQAGNGADFDAFRSALTDGAAREGFAEPGERFARYLDDNDGAEIVRKLAEESTDDLVAEYERVLAQAADSAGPAADPGGGAYDEAVWAAFVVEFGASWYGEVETWDAFRTWFLYHAEERGIAAPATDFLDYAEGESDRVAFFARYNVTIDVAPQGAAAGTAEEDSTAWQAFLAEYGPAWNGAEENWASFTPYFLHYADERGVPGLAAAFLDDAPDDNDARVQYFASYGITTGEEEDDDGRPADQTVPEPVTAEAIAEAQQQFTQLTEESDQVPDEHEDAITEAFAELVNQMPEAANLSREQMRELLATIPADQL